MPKTIGVTIPPSGQTGLLAGKMVELAIAARPGNR
jgi:hypothetical protein